MPGSAYFNPFQGRARRLEIMFHPEDVQEERRLYTADTFTELVVILQTQWRSTDSWMEIKWVPVTIVDVPLPETDDASLRPVAIPYSHVSSAMVDHSTSSTQKDGDSAPFDHSVCEGQPYCQQ